MNILAIKGSRGFTLIELIVVIIILGVVGVFTFQLLIGGVETYITIQKQKDLLDEATLCLERMSREIRDARQILAFTADSSIQFEKSHGTAYDSATTISFEYRAGFSDLRRIRGAEAGDVLAENVTAFIMSNTSNEIAIITTLSHASGESLTMETECFPKNLVTPPEGYKSFYRDGQGNWREEIAG
ncbi:MAG TPA: prepilin-type N-terminal cleavage/methylation domain-containing protein [Desulfatiglandales bacterium]|nr:prepilin-type N-terminal cleavage/methylation domain-containing protein [Desulfatiglandales bacterium]